MASWVRNGVSTMALTCGLMLIAGASGASTISATTPTITRDVASAVLQQHLSPAAQRSLLHAATDLALTNYPHRGQGESQCQTYGQCVYGDRSSSTTVALFGDSHAAMWLPALDPAAKELHLRLVVTWLGACPTAAVAPIEPAFGNPAFCNGFRKHADAEIIKGHPQFLILAEKTAHIPNGIPAHPWYSPTEITNGLITTIHTFQRAGITVGVLEDTPLFPKPVPTCLSQHSMAIRSCSVNFNDYISTGPRSAERTAAVATGAAYLSTHQWLCTSTCPAVINNIVAYTDEDHISYSYAATLHAPLAIELKRAMSRLRSAERVTH